MEWAIRQEEMTPQRGRPGTPSAERGVKVSDEKLWIEPRSGEATQRIGQQCPVGALIFGQVAQLAKPMPTP